MLPPLPLLLPLPLLPGESGASIDDGAHIASASYMGADVQMKAERKDGRSTILRVQALRDGQNVQDIADRVLAAVQRKLF